MKMTGPYLLYVVFRKEQVFFSSKYWWVYLWMFGNMSWEFRMCFFSFFSTGDKCFSGKFMNDYIWWDVTKSRCCSSTQPLSFPLSSVYCLLLIILLHRIDNSALIFALFLSVFFLIWLFIFKLVSPFSYSLHRPSSSINIAVDWKDN